MTEQIKLSSSQKAVRRFAIALVVSETIAIIILMTLLIIPKEIILKIINL